MNRQIYTVSELTAEIKALLEDRFPIVWMTGEISNFSIPASGHFYFSVKDKYAQISAVMFRGQNRRLKFKPEDGMQITGLGRIAIYEPRGTYQIIFEHLEPKGVGELQVAFEQLKNKLADEGLFDADHKRELPFLPKKIHLITSSTGAVVHDMIINIHRRFPNMPIDIIPVKVQGYEACEEIVNALSLLNNLPDAQVAVLARGGGSLEDMQPFNSESVARAVYGSNVPIVSAVGHETDFTISDFVSDLRASTPTAAAELVVPVKHELQMALEILESKLIQTSVRCINDLRKAVKQLAVRLVHPKRKLDDIHLKLDDLTLRLTQSVTQRLQQTRERLNWYTHRLFLATPGKSIEKLHVALASFDSKILISIDNILIKKRSQYRETIATLTTLNPLSILDRGYSITHAVNKKNNKKTIVSDPQNVSIKQDLEIIVAKGRIDCTVKGTKRNA